MQEYELRGKIREAKRRTLELCAKAGHGHPSSAFSCAEIVGILYYEIMRYRPDEPDWPDRDHFIMSKNHASVMMMPIMNDVGLISDADYETIMREGSTRTHHTNLHHPHMDFTGGALGIGLGVAAGIAKADQLNRREGLTFCVVGDAEECEGSIWESVLFAAQNRLKNLIVIVDQNHMGVSDYTENMLPFEPLEEKWRAFGWETRRVNGHDLGQLAKALGDVRTRENERPLCVIADTVKGKGMKFVEGQLLWHGVVPRGDALALAYRQLEEE